MCLLSYACIQACMYLHLHAHLGVYRAFVIVLLYRRMYPRHRMSSKCY
nr:MAG TPA: hypothetical protein [Bacteriophage sp.]